MADNELKVTLSAVIDNLTSGLSKASSQIGSFQKTATDAANSVKSAFLGISAVLGGGALFGEAIQSAMEFTSQNYQLAMSLGMTFQAATTMNIALREIGVSSDTYTSMAMKLDRQLRAHPELFEAIGVATRDSSGALLNQQEIMQNALAAMMTYQAGTDRNVVSLALFGRGATEAAQLIRLNADQMTHAKEIQDQLNIATGEDGVKQMHAYEQSMADVKLALVAAGGEMTKNLLPVIMDLAKTIVEKASPAIAGFRMAFDALKIALDFVATIFKQLVATIAAGASVIWDALHGNWSAVKADATAYFQQIEENERNFVKNTIANIQDIGKTWDAQMSNQKKGADGADMPAGGNKKAPAELFASKSPKADKSQMGAFEEEWRASYLKQLEDTGEYFTRSIEEESAFWIKKLALVDKGSNDELSIKRKLTELGISGYKEEFDENAKWMQNAVELDKVKAEEAIQASKATLASRKEDFDTQVALGVISKTQEIEALKLFTNQEYAIDLKALEDKKTNYEEGTKDYELALKDELALKQKHSLDMQKLDDKMKIDNMNTWKEMVSPIASAFETSINGIISGTQTLRQGLRNIGQAIVLDFVNLVIKKMVDQWLLGELMKINISKLFSGMLVALGITTSTEMTAQQLSESVMGTAATRMQAMTSIPPLAGMAAAGAAAAVAPTPFIGPALAAAAFGDTLALVMGAMSMVAASGGYDIGSESPIAQLHPREMVLPANLADNVRAMSGGGGKTIHFHGSPSSTMTMSDAAKLFKQVVRDGHVKFTR